tara:strand:+ start:2403 stop:4793 length:2391 start_codon:yes stop_codon:yes gene_type:complete
MKKIIGLYLFCLTFFWISVASAKTLYVSVNGADKHTGEIDQPLRTIQVALKQAQPGDTIIIGPGTYRETIRASKKRDVTIKAAREGDVRIVGTELLPQAWSEGDEGIWSQTLSQPIWQLFHEDKMAYVARWPNATFEDGKIWRMMAGYRSADGGYDQHKGKWIGKTRFGHLYDDRFHKPDSSGFREGDSRFMIDPTITFDDQPPSLASTGKDFTGAYAVLNIGHWLTWTRPITEHEAGADDFHYCTNNFFARYSQLNNVKHKFSSYHIIGLAALDQANEFWYDKDTKTVYYKPPSLMNPNQMAMSGRVRDFGVELNTCSNIQIKNIRFIGAGFWVHACDGVVIENCHFDYPAAPKFMLGELDWFMNFNSSRSQNKMPSFYEGQNNAFINNIVRYSNAPIAFESEGMRVENCLFSDIEWQLNSSGGSGSVMIGENGIFRRNTLTRAGNSEGVRVIDNGAVVELNHVYDVSNLQHDGSGINVGTRSQRNTRVAYNWVHDTNRQGVRFDYHGMGVYREDGKIYGDGVYQNNVTWNSRSNEIKGDRHLILNNTVINSSRYPDPFKEEVTISLQGFKALHDIEGNENSLIRNNIGTIRNRSWNLGMFIWNRKGEGGYKIPRSDVIPGRAEHNMTEPGASWKYLRDPKNYDFRPRIDSPLVNAGVRTTKAHVPSKDSNFKFQRIVGEAPDIGAYELGDVRYWIPGRQENKATMPIPKDKGKAVPLDADLMFLEAYNVSSHRILLGKDKDTLQVLKVLKDVKTNIVSLPPLKAKTTYFWRVDTYDEQSEDWKIGDLWSFATKN